MKISLVRQAFVFSAILTLTLSSCKKDPAGILPIDPVPIALTTNQVALIQSANSFAFDIFKEVVANAGETENIIISPLSISTALSMTLNGSNGPTRDAMLTALRSNGLTPEIINSSYKDLTKALLSVDKRVLITIANSVWTEKTFVVKKPFTDALTEYYSAEAKSFDINDPKVPTLINTWIDLKTNGLIKNMIDNLDPNTVMLLINAIYFKGKWNSQFDMAKTVQEPFTKPGGVTVQVPMMKQTSDFKVTSVNGFVLAEFPYGQGNYVMDVILPGSTSDLKTIVQSTSENNFNDWIGRLNTTKTELSFPRFKYGYKKELKDILTDMGMGVAFTSGADFSNIADQRLEINTVIHQALIETNEEGTEAAAATIVGITNMVMPMTFVLNIDHPFIYIIRETSTNSILFMGRVTDPLAN